ncbi:MAG: hypothetical protein M3O70_12375 [Actinomycetota bacterium]|nr:hypothetical protein [Actinomycetota bacterium]
MDGRDGDGAVGPHPRVLRVAGRVSQWSVTLPRAALAMAGRLTRVVESLVVWARSVGGSAWHAFWVSMRVWAPRE